VLQQLAQQVRDQYPSTSEIISNFMYVDDVLVGDHTQKSAFSAIKELRGAIESAVEEPFTRYSKRTPY